MCPRECLLTAQQKVLESRQRLRGSVAVTGKMRGKTKVGRGSSTVYTTRAFGVDYMHKTSISPRIYSTTRRCTHRSVGCCPGVTTSTASGLPVMKGYILNQKRRSNPSVLRVRVFACNEVPQKARHYLAPHAAKCMPASTIVHTTSNIRPC